MQRMQNGLLPQKDRHFHFTVYHVLNEILKKGPHLGKPSVCNDSHLSEQDDDIDMNDVYTEMEEESIANTDIEEYDEEEKAAAGIEDSDEDKDEFDSNKEDI